MDKNKGRNNVGYDAEINPNGQMRGYIDIKGFGVRDLLSDITVGRHDSIEIESEFEIDYKSNSKGFDSDITVAQRGNSEISTELFIYPNARMRGLADIIEAPKKVVKIYPSKDSTVREAAPILNYGKSSQMMAGKEATGKLMSYLGFTMEWPEDLDELITAKLVLNKEYPTDKAFLMGIFETNDDWLEDYITWSYRPTENKYLSQFPIPKDTGRVEADITDFASSWAEVGGSKSFTLQPRNYDFSELTTFSTKEGNEPPYIEITYYEVPKSGNVIDLDSELTVSIRSSRSIDTTIMVENDFTHEEIISEVTVEGKPVDRDLDTLIEVSIRGINELETEIELNEKVSNSELNTGIKVPYVTYIENTIEIESKYGDEAIDTDITIKAYDENDLSSEIGLKNKNTSKDMDTEVTIRVSDGEDLGTELVIERKVEDSELDSIIVVKQDTVSEVDSEITLARNLEGQALHTEMVIGQVSTNDLDTEFIIERKAIEDEIEVEMNIIGYVELDSEIEVPKVDGEDELEIELIVPYVNDLGTDVDIEEKLKDKDIPTNLTILPKEVVNDLEVHSHVRAFWAEEIDMSIIIERKFEIEVELEVRVSGGDYAFII